MEHEDIKNYTSNSGKDTYLPVLILLILFHGIGNVIWIILNKVPPMGDAASHTSLTIQLFDYLFRGNGNMDLFEILRFSNYYPPLMYFLGLPFVFFGNYAYQPIQLTGTLFLAGSLIYTYYYASRLFNSRMIGFWTSFFLSFFISIYQQSRLHMLDIPLIFFVVAGSYYLTQSEGLKKKKETILCFVSLAFALLVKWYGFLFFVIPFAMELWKARGHIVERGKLPHLRQAALICLLIAGPWYAVNLASIIQLGRLYVAPLRDVPHSFFSLENLIYYVKLILGFQTGFIGGIFLLISSFLAFLNKKVPKKLLFLQIFFVYVVFTFIGNKNIRILFPLMPFFAMIMAYGIYWLATKTNLIVSAAATSLVVCYFLVVYFVLSFGIPVYPTYKYAAKLPVLGWTDLIYLHTYPVSLLYDSTDWKNDELAKAISRELANNKQQTFLTVMDKEYMKAATIKLALYHSYTGPHSAFKELDTGFQTLLRGQRQFPDEDALQAYLNGADYVITNTEEVGPKDAMVYYDVFSQIQQYVLKMKDINYVEKARIQLPDGDTVLLLKKI